MSFWSVLTGTTRPAGGTVPRPAAEVRAAVLALDGHVESYVVRDGAAEGADLVAEWRFEDGGSHEAVGASRKPKSFRILMQLHEAAHEVRAVDKAVNLFAGPDAEVGARTWTQGTGFRTSRSIEFDFSGWRISNVRRHRFSTRDLRTPLQNTVTAAGWTWRGTAF